MIQHARIQVFFGGGGIFEGGGGVRGIGFPYRSEYVLITPYNLTSCWILFEINSHFHQYYIINRGQEEIILMHFLNTEFNVCADPEFFSQEGGSKG